MGGDDDSREGGMGGRDEGGLQRLRPQPRRLGDVLPLPTLCLCGPFCTRLQPHRLGQRRHTAQG
nr:MAG TPA: hypothetical protein [Caudoviricetes sp.]